MSSTFRYRPGKYRAVQGTETQGTINTLLSNAVSVTFEGIDSDHYLSLIILTRGSKNRDIAIITFNSQE